MNRNEIVVLDGYTLHDLSWKELEMLGNLTVYPRTREEEIVSRARNAQILLTNKTPLSRNTLSVLPDLRYIGVLATGYDVIDIKAAEERGITVTNIPTYGTDSVAQMVFALLLELCHHVQHHSDAVKDGEWSRRDDWSFWKYPLVELSGKTMGILGYGRIGRRVAEIACAFGMSVIVCDPIIKNEEREETVRYVDLDELFQMSDILSLHCPLLPETRAVVNKRTLSLVKPGLVIINTSRGGLVVDEDLAEALASGTLSGAALDVLSLKEPPREDNPLLKAERAIITPHIAWATEAARKRLLSIASDNLKSFLQGRPIHTVSTRSL